MKENRGVKARPADSTSRREQQKAEIRAELLAAAHALVKDDGYEGLTIRKLADRVGYAPMSVYSYFADKQAILRALAEDAFVMLAQRMEDHLPDEPLAALRKVMWDYAAFGLENPNEYRTVFMTGEHRPDPGKTAEEMERNNPALQVLLKRVSACVEAGIFRGDVRAFATMLWTIGHGTVSLLITFPKYPFGDQRRFVQMSMDVALAGLAAHPVEPLADTERSC